MSSDHWDDHDVVRMAQRVRELEIALDARRQELEWVVSERDSLRTRVAELEERLADEFVTRRAAEERLAAWEPVVRAAQRRRLDDDFFAALNALPFEHYPPVEEVEP